MLGHETMVCAVCLSIFVLIRNSALLCWLRQWKMPLKALSLYICIYIYMMLNECATKSSKQIILAPSSNFMTKDIEWVTYETAKPPNERLQWSLWVRCSFHKTHEIMTSSNGKIIRVIGPLCGEFTGSPVNPHTQKPVTRSFYGFFDLRLSQH